MSNNIARAIEWIKAFTGNSRKGIADVLLSLVPQISRSFFGFLTSIVLARGLGPGGMGQYALVLSISDTVTSLSDLGINQTAIRYASGSASQSNTDGQLAVIRWAFRLRLMTVIGISLLFFFFLPSVAENLWHSKELTPLMNISLLMAVFISLASIPAIYFQSLQRFGMSAVILTVQGIIAFSAVAIISLYFNFSVERVINFSTIAACIGMLFSFFFLPGKAILPRGWSLNGTFEEFKRFWRIPSSIHFKNDNLESAGAEKFAYYLLLSSIIVMFTLRLDLWLMGMYLEQSQIGLYSIASRTALPLMFLLNAFSTALWPRASSLTNVEEVQSLLKKTMKASIIVATAGVVYSLVIPMFIPKLFGDVYEESVILAQIISIGYCIAILANPMSMVGYSFGLARIYWIVNLVQMVVVIIMLVLLLPRFGVMGAALTFVANNLTGGVINGYLVLMKSRQLRQKA